MKDRRCETCRYWDWEPVLGDQGTCQRYPILTELTKTGTYLSYWPRSKADGWCGEWAEKKPENLQEG